MENINRKNLITKQDQVDKKNPMDKNFEIRRTFGLGVLLKLTKKSFQGIEISSQGDKFVSNVGVSKLSQAVDTILKRHNITLKY